MTQLGLPFDGPAPPALRGQMRTVSLPGGVLSYVLVRARRRTLAIHADASGVEARAPHRLSVADIDAFIRSREKWIRRRLAEPRPRAFTWEDGALLPWLGRTLAVTLAPARAETALCGERLEIGLAGGRASARERGLQWLQQEALALLGAKVAALSRRADISVAAVALSNARTLWGSCTARGVVRLNWRLMMLPGHLIDYVVAHELAHRRELNHSRRFWAIVGELHPGHAEARRELRRLARTLPEL